MTVLILPQPSLAASNHPRSASGSALVVTLAVLVLMSIMIISLSDIMRVERGSAYTHLEKARAELMAEMGTAKVVATLRNVTTDTNSVTGRNWISRPGQIVASTPNSISKAVVDPPILLSSDKPDKVTFTSVPAFLRPAQLNVPTFDTVNSTGAIAPHLISNQEDPDNPGKAVSMAVRWIYVRKDGTEDTSEQPVLDNATNPIVGRYGYWTDDESCKVNYNLAWTRSGDNPNPASHPTKINLPTLFGPNDPDAETKAKAIHFYDPTGLQTPPLTLSTIAAYQGFSRFFFHTPEDARQVAWVKAGAGVDTALLAARFNVTHYNHDPDTTFFNQPRIVLTTRKDRANGRPFLDIGTIDNADLGYLDNVSGSKLYTVLTKLNSYLQRSDWPMASGSLQSKYYAGDPTRLTQLSLNIIDYVRSKESASQLVVPLRGYFSGNTWVITTGTDPNSYIGITRTPRFTELGVFIPQNPTTAGGKTYAAIVKVEVSMPNDFGLNTPIDLTTLKFWVNVLNVDGSDTDSAESMLVSTPGEALLTSSEVSPTTLSPGGRAVIRKKVNITYSSAGTSRPTGESHALVRLALALPGAAGGSNRLDVVPLLGDKQYLIRCKVNSPTTLEAAMPSVEVDDPRINSNKDDWKDAVAVPPQPPNTFGAVNSISTLGTSPSPTMWPEQDVDKSGKITDLSLVMPAPAKLPNMSPNTPLSSNPNGVVSSVGELGFISTGLKSAGAPGIPWRTLHLRPSKPALTGAMSVPDWAFMDLFTVPADIRKAANGQPDPHALAIYSPHGNTTGGRVNMNAKPEPFDLDRKDPLVAVFEGATFDATNLNAKLSSTQAKTIVDAVYNRTLAAPKSSAGLPGGFQYGYQNGYDSPGEVVEMSGVADNGEESEQLVREIANLITARGNVFSVYTVGQALKQTPTGSLIVTGEQRQQAMIERYSDTSGIHIRPVFFRSLTP